MSKLIASAARRHGGACGCMAHGNDMFLYFGARVRGREIRISWGTEKVAVIGSYARARKGKGR